ncbi:MAG: hypothetical protein KAJ35_07550, partial [Thermoplasmata archaeon]|nr:hypothetical protein [Thermoplasmata archaeon]
MRYWGLLIVTLVLLAPCGQGAFPHYYQGEKDSSLMAIVTYDDVEYGLGDRITITLHLFKGGEPVDADTVEVKIGRYEGEARNDHYKHVSMVRKPLGVYVGEYTIVLEDVPRDWGNMEIIARVELEGDVAWSVRRVYIAPPHDLDLTIHRLDGSEHLRPGEERAFLFLVTLDEKPFDPDHIEVEWRPAGGTWLPHVSAEPTREGKGRYTHTYQAPFTNESSREGLWVDVRHTTEEGLNLTAYDHTWMYVQQMHVWAKRVRTSMEGSTFDLHISDWEGTAIGDSFVELEYDYRSNDGWTTGREREWTDGGGVARVVLEYEDMVEDSTTVEISGTVTAGDIVQKVKFDMDLRHDDEENGWEPSPYGLDINEDGLVYEPGRDQTLRTKVFLDGEPLKDKWVQCYIASREEVLIYKRTSTDGDGMLSFKFTTPDLKGSMRRIGDLFVLVEDDPYEVGQFDVVFGRPYIDPLWDRSIWEYLEHFQTNEVKVTTETTGRRVDVRVECQQA